MPVRRKILFAAIVAGLVYGVAEVGAFVTYWIVFDEPLSLSGNLARRAEIAAGLSAGEPGTLPTEDPFQERTRRALHPYLGYVVKPDEQPDGTFYGINFGRNPVHKRAPGRVIVGVFGGSVAAGFRDERLGTLLDGLAQSPRFAGKEIVVVTVAQAGYKQPQQLLALMYLRSLGAEFDVVINFDGFNEVALHPIENGRKGIAAIFPRNWYRWAMISPDEEMLRLTGERVFHEGRRMRAAAAFSRFPARYSAVANLVWRYADRAAQRAVIDADLSLMAYTPENVPWETSGPVREYATESEMMDDLAAIWSRCSLLMDTFCAADGIEYFHFLQPNQYVADSKQLSPRELEDAYRADSPYADGATKGYPLLIAEGQRLKQLGVRFEDLSRVFSEVNETLYIDTCCHFNETGYGILGEVMATFIVESLDADEPYSRLKVEERGP